MPHLLRTGLFSITTYLASCVLRRDLPLDWRSLLDRSASEWKATLKLASVAKVPVGIQIQSIQN